MLPFSVIRQDGRTPVKYGITLDMEAKYSDLKPSLSQLCKISPQNLILVDIVHAQFRVSAELPADPFRIKHKTQRQKQPSVALQHMNINTFSSLVESNPTKLETRCTVILTLMK